MKTHELERHLKKHGCELRRAGKHLIYVNPQNNRTAPVPKPHQREIPLGTLRSICKLLAIPRAA